VSEEDIYSAKRRRETARKRFEKRQLMASWVVSWENWNMPEDNWITVVWQPGNRTKGQATRDRKGQNVFQLIGEQLCWRIASNVHLVRGCLFLRCWWSFVYGYIKKVKKSNKKLLLCLSFVYKWILPNLKFNYKS